MQTTKTFKMTMAVVKLAASLMPITRIAVPKSVKSDAGMAGRLTPKSRRNARKWPLQPTATVAAPKAYSRIRSQPIIQAMSSRNASKNKRENNRRSGKLGRRLTGDDENSGADDGADSERNQVDRP